jgi:ubiquinone/menaquinone biosynthesis C-methylase UbiE
LVVQQKVWHDYGGTGPELYERYLVPAMFGPWAVDLVELASPKLGERVLDVACGTGIVSRLAFQRVGSSGKVVGLDLNPGMLAVARSVSSDMNIDWREEDATAMQLADASFDLVLCQQGLQFIPNKPTAVREMRRVLVPGGRLVTSTWTPIRDTPGFALLAEGLKRHISAEAASFMELPFSLGNEEELRRVMAGSGFRGIKIHSVTKQVNFPSPDEFVRRYVAGSPLAGIVGKIRPESKEALLQEMNKVLDHYMNPHGLTFPTKTRFLVANA